MSRSTKKVENYWPSRTTSYTGFRLCTQRLCLQSFFSVVFFSVVFFAKVVFSGSVHDKQLVSLCYEWLRPSDELRGLSNHYIVIKTFRRASVLSSDRRGFLASICVEISWTCLGTRKDVLFVASLTSCCRCCSLIWLLLSNFVWVWRSLAMQRKVLGWFYFRYFGFFMARDQSRPFVDPPRGCVNEFLQARQPLPLTHPVTH